MMEISKQIGMSIKQAAKLERFILKFSELIN